MPNYKQNSFNDNTKIAIITAVHPDAKTVDIKYASQQGTYDNLSLPYSVVGTTWGVCYMPLKGDKVLVDCSNNDKPVIKSMYPNQTSLLPYMDPGEVSILSENGSYLHLKNQRKRAISSDTLLDYDATVGANGQASDIAYEPSGVILRVRTKQNRDQVAPRFQLHSSLSMFDNADINLQSMKNNIPKGLLHFNSTGYVFLMAGDNSVQEYLEMNPLKKETLLFF